MTKFSPWLSCVLVTDRRLYGREFVREVLAAAKGRATSILLREKYLPDETLLELGKELSQAASIPLILSSKPHLVSPMGAQGVHLPGYAGSIAEVRRVIPEGAIIGVSVHGVLEGVRRAAEGADYLLLGPIRETPKPHPHPPCGFETLAELCRRVEIPVVAIGGLLLSDQRLAAASGAVGIAAIRAFAPIPEVRG